MEAAGPLGTPLGLAQRKRASPRGVLFTFHFHALEKEMATHSGVLAWRIPGTEEPSGLLSRKWHREEGAWALCPRGGHTCHFLLQGIFPTQGWNPGHRGVIYPWNSLGKKLKWVVNPFSREFS